MGQVGIEITDNLFDGCIAAFQFDETQQVGIDMLECIDHFLALPIVVVVAAEVVLEV